MLFKSHLWRSVNHILEVLGNMESGWAMFHAPRSRDRPRTRRRDYMSQLAWECLISPQSIWISRLKLLPPDPDKRQKIKGNNLSITHDFTEECRAPCCDSRHPSLLLFPFMKLNRAAALPRDGFLSGNKGSPSATLV